MEKLGPLFVRITKRYGITIRTATQVRKSVATRVTKDCMDERRIVAKQLSHSVETSAMTQTVRAAADEAKHVRVGQTTFWRVLIACDHHNYGGALPL